MWFQGLSKDLTEGLAEFGADLHKIRDARQLEKLLIDGDGEEDESRYACMSMNGQCMEWMEMKEWKWKRKVRSGII